MTDPAFLSSPALVQQVHFSSPTCQIRSPSFYSNALPVTANCCQAFSWDTSFHESRHIGAQRRKVVVLWLRLGDLRLADNAAVDFCKRFTGSVLPLLTLNNCDMRLDVLDAVAELRSGLEQLGTTLIIRSNDCEGEVGALNCVLKIIGSRCVVTNSLTGLSPAKLEQLRSGGTRFQVCSSNLGANDGWYGALFERPKVFPRLPEQARHLSTNIEVQSRIGGKGEQAAICKLRHLLTTCDFQQPLTAPIWSIIAALKNELIAGSVSRARIIFECEQKRLQSSSKPNFFEQRFKAFFVKFRPSRAVAALSVVAYDVNGGDRRGVEWDEETKSFRLQEWEHTEMERRMNFKERWQEFWRRRRLFFIRSFFPEDVTPDYYSFTAWRFSQRCVSATIGVFGTSSLLFALGIRSGRIGQAAVISWVLKDGLGRVGKMVWAGSMGKDFDVDPKRWRFRSAMLYAMGNGLEIVTQIFPASFLVFATLANSMKQVSMLTASATRNAMYRSFGDRSQNIANITAKGEAQIVVADLIGMGCGIRLSKILASSRQNILAMYCGLTILDLFGIYMELRQVVFRTLNAERTSILVSNYMRDGRMMTPSEVSPKESIFLKPRYQFQVRLSSIAKAAKDPKELDLLLRVFRREHFLVAPPPAGSGQPCRLVLRKDASNEDVLRAFLLIGYVQKKMRSKEKKRAMSTEEQEQVLRSARKWTKRNYNSFLGAVRDAGWSTDNLLFSTMKRRGYWGRESASHAAQ
eukprot:GFKZ01011663.1.p1 GENE.GFKZ01011663.1~~GFKZ01011663.1.p1  ORF type:complete len:746 (+),score=74.12 GFKZ01011663.1:182-2419(+)